MLGLLNVGGSEGSGRKLGGFGRAWDSFSGLYGLLGAPGGENEDFEVRKFEVATFGWFT